MISRAYHPATFNIAVSKEAARVCYVLIPEGLSADTSKWAEEVAQEFKCNLVFISGIDWNRDMSPWSAKGVMKKEKEFTGGADIYLKALTEDYIPDIEKQLFSQNPENGYHRYLIGISLSGLFAVWSIFKTSLFDGIGAISASLWFDGFTEWASNQTPASSAKLRICLGSREKNSLDKRLATVEQKSRETVSILMHKGLDAALEMVPGTHFSPMEPRFRFILGQILTSTEFSK